MGRMTKRLIPPTHKAATDTCWSRLENREPGRSKYAWRLVSARKEEAATAVWGMTEVRQCIPANSCEPLPNVLWLKSSVQAALRATRKIYIYKSTPSFTQKVTSYWFWLEKWPTGKEMCSFLRNCDSDPNWFPATHLGTKWIAWHRLSTET